jgi:hypothetical protein
VTSIVTNIDTSIATAATQFRLLGFFFMLSSGASSRQLFETTFLHTLPPVVSPGSAGVVLNETNRACRNRP